MRIFTGTSVAGIATAMAFSLLAGCGTQARSTPAQGAAIQEQATRLFTDITGDAAARDAAGFLVNYGANLGLQQCMTRASFSLPVTIINGWYGWHATTGVSGSRFLVTPGERLISPGLLMSAAADRATAAAAVAKPKDDRPAYQAALLTCANEAAPADWDEPLTRHDESGVPDSAVALRDEFLTLLDDADEAASRQGEDYASCMTGQGYPGVTGYTDVASRVAARTPAAEDIPLPGQQPTAAWTKFLAEESAASRADITCRTEQYALGVAGLGTRLQEFETDHADALTQVRADWAATVDAAVRHGFDPNTLVQVVKP